jgi:hypothetical protein
MMWSTPDDLRAQAQRLWETGRLLTCLVEPGELFPLRLTLKLPGSADLSERFDEVRAWARALQAGAGDAKRRGYRVMLRDINHRVIGANQVPSEAWLDTLDDALELIGRRRDARRFESLLAQARAAQPTLLPWLRRRSLRALELASHWPLLLDVIAWVQAHPRSGIYLRQVDLPGIHGKFIEEHRSVLAELLDCCLPADAIAPGPSGVANFARRYGFRDKPQRVRFRVLDPQQALLTNCAEGADRDITLTQDDFARLAPPASHIFLTENEINFLAFPALPDSLLIFGAGYGFDMLTQAHWLHGRQIAYWGDIDTHGFAILDQLRDKFPHATSFLMDRSTLLVHRPLWTDEPEPTQRDLPRLTAEERALYDDLRWKRLGDAQVQQVRLEQERIGFGHIEQALACVRIEFKATLTQ